MQKNWLVCFVILGVLFGLSNLASSGDKIEEFSAEQVHIGPDGKVGGVYKVHSALQKMRMEMPVP